MSEQPVVFQRRTLDEVYRLVMEEKKVLEAVEVEGLVYGIVFYEDSRRCIPRFIIRDDVLLLQRGVKTPVIHHQHVAFVDGNYNYDHNTLECYLRGACGANQPVLVRGKATTGNEPGLVGSHLYIKAREIIVDGLTFKNLP